jgi:phosphatidylserine/phosphatidylglycerophosphate/cardiolipin synthase-like enzyme
MAIPVKAHQNGDDVFLVWRPDDVIVDCRGFAIEKKKNGGAVEVLPTWMGFAGTTWKKGERKPSTAWPVQKFTWVDYSPRDGETVQYRVVPMVGKAGALRRRDDLASKWTAEIEVTPRVSKTFSCYFNRGIVAAQWVQRLLGPSLSVSARRKKLDEVIVDLENPIPRNILSGMLRDGLRTLLQDAKAKKRKVEAALFELTDEELIGDLAALGAKARVVLADGSTNDGSDENAEARPRLVENGVEVHDRMTKKKYLAHNKMLVVYDGKTPRWTWTGSLNWTPSGLCTQANNAVLIDNRDIATHFAKQIDLLAKAKNLSPKTLAAANSKPKIVKAGDYGVRVWFTRTVGQVDLKDATALIDKAKEGALFLMFMTGMKDSLLKAVLDHQKDDDFFIHGVISQQPPERVAKKVASKKKLTREEAIANQVAFVNRNERVRFAPDLLLPMAREKATEQWFDEFVKKNGAHAIVHSKIVVLDPFGAKPVVITGSHNMGIAASKKNDENLVVIEGDSALAAAYAVNILSIYNNYRWRFRLNEGTKFAGLYDHDKWQKSQLNGAPGKELAFWGLKP